MAVPEAVCLAAEAGCCLCSICSCCCRCFSCCCKGREGENGEKAALAYPRNCGKYGSLTLMFVAIVLALAGEFWGFQYLEDDKVTDAWTSDCDDDSCFKYSAVYRVSFATAAIFFIMIGLSAVSPMLHDYGWDIKFFVWFAAIVGFVFTPGNVFDPGYVWFARVGAFVFLVLQQIILVDFAYTVNETLYKFGTVGGVKEDEMNGWLLLLVGLSVTLFALALTGIVLMFVYFNGCSTSDSFISITLIAVLAFTAVQLTAPEDSGHNLLVSSVVACYVVYLTYVAVSSNPTDVCNPLYSDSDSVTGIVIGLIIAFCSIMATVYFASQSVTDFLDGDLEAPSKAQSDKMTADLLTNDQLPGGSAVSAQPAAASSSAVEVEEDQDPVVTRASTSSQMRGSANANIGDGQHAWKFNLVMMLITFYWTMVLTDWGNSGDIASDSSPTAGNTAMWMNIVASWICALLYTWTLVAPRLFPDRDFS